MSKIIIGTANGRSVGFEVSDLLKSRLLITADSGAGKSWLIRVLLEQAFGKVPIIVIDPEGEFATLREKYDYVLVGKGGETPADPRSAALVARRLLELQASAVCDIYELKHQARHQWVRLFLDALIEAPKELWHPYLIVVDEAHAYCPEKGKGESEAYGPMVDLCTKGRKRGFCAVFATQTLASLNKSASGQLQNRLIGAQFEDVNRKRAAEILGILRTEEREFARQLQMLETGSFYALGRAISRERVLVRIRGVQTTHPEMGVGKHAAVVPPVPEKIRALLPKLADLPKEAEDKARTESDFRREITELRRQLTIAQKAQPQAVADPAAIGRAVNQATEPLRRQLNTFQLAAQQANKAISEVSASLGVIANAKLAERAAVAGHTVPNRTAGGIPVSPPPRPRSPSAGNGDGTIAPAKMRILRALAEFDAIGVAAVSKKWLAARAGASHKSSAYKNNLGELRSGGLLDYRGGDVCLTEAGKALVPAEAPLTTQEMADSCRRLLTPAECRIFDVLYQSYPQQVAREDLAPAAGASVTSSAFKNNLGTLRSAGMIDYGTGGVFMKKWIFLETN